MKNLHYILLFTLLFTFMYSCKTDAIDACDTNCSKCIALNSKDYNMDNSISAETNYEHDNNFNFTKITEVKYSKGKIYSTVTTVIDNIYENKLLMKRTQKVDGQIKEYSNFQYHYNNKLKKVESRDKNNNLNTSFEYNENGKLLNSYEKYAEIYETKYTYDSKGNELTKYHYTNGQNDFSYISEYNSENNITKQTYNESYPNQTIWSKISTYSYKIFNKLSEINYQYVGRKTLIDKDVYSYNDKNLLISTISYLGKATIRQSKREYDNNGLLIKISNSYDSSPFEVFGELSYYPSGKVKQQISTVIPSWYKYISYTFDENSNLISFEFLDSSKKVVLKTISSYSCVK